MQHIMTATSSLYERACLQFEHTGASDVVFARHIVRLALFDCWADGRMDDEGTRTLARVIAHLNLWHRTGR